ncbi:hypothetical protein NKG05_08305 [Oerskovia sp. M15]
MQADAGEPASCEQRRQGVRPSCAIVTTWRATLHTGVKTTTISAASDIDRTIAEAGAGTGVVAAAQI